MKNLSAYFNHVENSITKTLIYYFMLVTFTISGFLIGTTSNLIKNRGSAEIQNKDGSIYQNTYYENSTSSKLELGTENNSENKIDKNTSIIFGSSKGKYFYYKGCGGETISKNNLRYYKSEAEAIKAGKKLYSKCE